MKLSIIVTIYNNEKQIERCLQSIVSQTYKDYELIIINDGSTDNSERIIKDFFKSHRDIDFKLYSGKNVGANLARQKGIRKSSGKYIGFVDSDDYIENDFYQRLMDETDDEADIVCSEYILEGKGEIQRHGDRELLKQKYLSSRQAKLALLNHQGVYPYLWNKVIRKSLFECIEYLDTKYIGEDFTMIIQLLDKATEIVMIDYNGYHYVMNSSSQTKAGYSLLHKNMYEVFSRLYEENKDKDQEFTSSLERYLLLHYMSILVNLARANKKEPELENKIRSFVIDHYKDYIRNTSDGFKAKVAVWLACKSYPLFRIIASRM